jgi:SAM-dependent methyltransferase
MHSESIYESSRLAASYAYGRPPVHQHIIQRAQERLGSTTRLRRALDIGCGAGLSTAVLGSFAEIVVGLETARAMLVHHLAVAPHALFLVSGAEMLPFSSGVFDLMTAAGSLNYVNTDLFLPEAARVLSPEGVLLIYDFSAGRHMRGDHQLDEWFTIFEDRYPSPPGYELDVKGLAYQRFGLRLKEFEELEVSLPMTLGSYVSYAMSETNVELAITLGESETEIRAWCHNHLVDIFESKSREVLFSAYIAYICRNIHG